MFFLLRMAFWLGLVLVLLPTDKTAETDKAPKVRAMDAATAAAAAMSDMTQFCKRQAEACEIGGKAAAVIGQRAQSGARKVYQFITDKKQGEDKKPAEKQADHTGSIIAAAHNSELSRDTLTDNDLQPTWRAPAAAQLQRPVR